MMSQIFKEVEKLAEKYRLQAESYYLQLEARKSSSNALIALTGIIIQMTKDLRSYELKTGKNAATEKRAGLIRDLVAISDVFYPIWTELDNTRTVLADVIKERDYLAKEVSKLKNEIEALKKTFEEL